jgi:hypothetical protein
MSMKGEPDQMPVDMICWPTFDGLLPEPFGRLLHELPYASLNRKLALVLRVVVLIFSLDDVRN